MPHTPSTGPRPASPEQLRLRHSNSRAILSNASQRMMDGALFRLVQETLVGDRGGFGLSILLKRGQEGQTRSILQFLKDSFGLEDSWCSMAILGIWDQNAGSY